MGKPIPFKTRRTATIGNNKSKGTFNEDMETFISKNASVLNTNASSSKKENIVKPKMLLRVYLN